MYCANCGSPKASETCAVCGQASNFDSPKTAVLSGWWRRVGATLIDNLVLILPNAVVSSVVAGIAGNAVVGALFGTLVQGLYFVTLLKSPRGQTIGNRVAKTKVVDQVTGGQLSQPQALKRWGFIAVYQLAESLSLTAHAGAAGVVVVVCGVVGIVDVTRPLWNKQNQTMHDTYAATLVILA